MQYIASNVFQDKQMFRTCNIVEKVVVIDSGIAHTPGESDRFNVLFVQLDESILVFRVVCVKHIFHDVLHIRVLRALVMVFVMCTQKRTVASWLCCRFHVYIFAGNNSF